MITSITTAKHKKTIINCKNNCVFVAFRTLDFTQNELKAASDANDKSGNSMNDAHK